MAVDVYLYDVKKRLRQAIVWGISQLIHDERDFMLTAKIRADYGAAPGEFLGFMCADGRYRLFEIETAEEDEETGEATITATEAAVARLAHSIAKEIRLTKKTAEEAARKALEGSEFTLGTVTAGSKKADVSEYYQTRWKALREIETAYGVRAVPYYTTDKGQITGAYVDLLERSYPESGRVFTGNTDASRIIITRSGIPITRMYGLGEATGTEDPPTRLTFESIAWSKENGDPIDKPKGQAYIEDPDAVEEYGEGREAVFEDKNIADKEELLKATYEEYERRRRPLVSGSAQLYDMRTLPGYEHKAVEIYTTAHVLTARGEMIEAKIIDVQRNYIEEERTQITFGEEETGENSIRTAKKLTEQVAKVENKARRLGGSSSAAGKRYIETKQLIQLNANTIQLNAENIELNADKIRATNLEVDKLKADNAEFGKMLSGSSTINSLSVVSLSINRRQVRGFTITIEGRTYHLFGYD